MTQDARAVGRIKVEAHLNFHSTAAQGSRNNIAKA
jgi:hypothetical protein